MKIVKMSLANMQGKMSRIEMKGIMAGSGCGWRSSDGLSQSCGTTQANAMAMQSNHGGFWCCSSCQSNGGSASYC